MEGYEIQPHIRLGKHNVRPIVLCVGDPARVDMISNMVDSYKDLAFNREFKSIECCVDGTYFTVISHGVGSPGAAVVHEELICCGAKVIIRAGTAGSLQRDIKRGDICISYAAVKQDGVSAALVPATFPAVASPEVYQALVASAKELNATVSTGICVTTDVFYNPKVFTGNLEQLSRANVKIVSMEESVLFVLGTLNKIWTGVIHVVDGNVIQGVDNDYDPTGLQVTKGKELMLKIAFKAIKKLSEMINTAQ